MADEYGTIVMEIGGRGHLGDDVLHRMCRGPALAHRQSPQAMIILTIGGYDEDPRELWQIPETREYIRNFCKLSGLHDWRGELFQALDETTKALIITCKGVDEPHPFVVAFEY